jgi:hypothetical protein
VYLCGWIIFMEVYDEIEGNSIGIFVGVTGGAVGIRANPLCGGLAAAGG